MTGSKTYSFRGICGRVENPLPRKHELPQSEYKAHDFRLRLLERHRRYNRDAPQQSAQCEIRIAADMDKLEWVFRFASAGLCRIGVEHEADLGLWRHLHDPTQIEPRGGIAQVQIRKFVVDVSIENYNIRFGA